jgi:hypothetical protein
MGYRLYIAFIDGSCNEQEVMNHEIDHVQTVVEQASKQHVVRVDLEDRNQNVIYQYRRKHENAY